MCRKTRATIRSNIEIMRYLTNRINQSQDFVRLAPAPLSVVCFQYLTTDTSIQPDQKYLDELNTRLLDRLEKDGRVFLSGTKSWEKGATGMQCQSPPARDDIDFLLEVIRDWIRKFSRRCNVRPMHAGYKLNTIACASPRLLCIFFCPTDPF